MSVVEDFNEWYKKARDISGGSNPEDVLTEDPETLKTYLDLKQLEHLSPIPDYKLVDINRDYSDMQAVVKVGDTHLMLTGRYDSWNGTEWDDYENWEEVVLKERVEKYWSRRL